MKDGYWDPIKNLLKMLEKDRLLIHRMARTQGTHPDTGACLSLRAELVIGKVAKVGNLIEEAILAIDEGAAE
jgi:hypothetical protein